MKKYIEVLSEKLNSIKKSIMIKVLKFIIMSSNPDKSEEGKLRIHKLEFPVLSLIVDEAVAQEFGQSDTTLKKAFLGQVVSLLGVVKGDESPPAKLIEIASRSGESFDYKVKLIDSSEVPPEMIHPSERNNPHFYTVLELELESLVGIVDNAVVHAANDDELELVAEFYRQAIVVLDYKFGFFKIAAERSRDTSANTPYGDKPDFETERTIN